jgi:hypothetical protein
MHMAVIISDGCCSTLELPQRTTAAVQAVLPYCLALTVNYSASYNQLFSFASWLLKCTRTIYHDKSTDGVTCCYVLLLVVSCCLVLFKLWSVETCGSLDNFQSVWKQISFIT